VYVIGWRVLLILKPPVVVVVVVETWSESYRNKYMVRRARGTHLRLPLPILDEVEAMLPRVITPPRLSLSIT